MEKRNLILDNQGKVSDFALQKFEYHLDNSTTSQIPKTNSPKFSYIISEKETTPIQKIKQIKRR